MLKEFLSSLPPEINQVSPRIMRGLSKTPGIPDRQNESGGAAVPGQEPAAEPGIGDKQDWQDGQSEDTGLLPEPALPGDMEEQNFKKAYPEIQGKGLLNGCRLPEEQQAREIKEIFKKYNL
jgi:hypothetical protein